MAPERRRTRPLQHAKHHDLADRLRRAAQHRGEGKAQDAADIEWLAAEAQRSQPTGAVMIAERDVGGQDPDDLVVAGREAALHVRQPTLAMVWSSKLQHRGADRARGDHRPVGCIPKGHILVDGFSRHGFFNDRVVAVSPASAQAGDADSGASPSKRPAHLVRGIV